MNKPFKCKILAEPDNESRNNPIRKSIRKKWLKLGTDRNDIQNECFRVFNAIQNLANESSKVSTENDIKSDPNHNTNSNEVSNKVLIEKVEAPADTNDNQNHNFGKVGSPNSEAKNDEQHKEETIALKDVNMNDILQEDLDTAATTNPRVAVLPEPPSPMEFQEKQNKISIKVSPATPMEHTASSTKKISKQVSSSSASTSSSNSKFRCSRPTIKLFERKLSKNPTRDKSPYSCEVNGLGNEEIAKTSKMHVSFRNYNILSKAMGELRKNSGQTPICDNCPNKTRPFLTCTEDIIPLWSLDMNDKSLPYPKSSISSQYTQTNSSDCLCLKNVSQSTSANLQLSKQENHRPLNCITKDMKEAIYAATEAGVALMNTVFINDLKSPKATTVITEIPEFVDFIHATNEMEALDKMANLYELASQRIKKYKCKLKTSQTDEIPFPQNTRFSQKVGQILNILTRKPKHKQRIEKKLSRAHSIWSFDHDFSSHQFDISLACHSGELDQDVCYDKRIYRTTFKGTFDDINILTKANCQSKIPAQLRPYLVLQMIEKTSSFASTRIVAAKYYCMQVVNRLCPIAQHFLDGKYCILHEKKKFPKLIKKFRGISVTSGILQHLAHDLLIACSIIHKVFGKQTGLETVSSRHDIPGFVSDESAAANIPVSAKLTASNAIRNLQDAINELNSLLEIGESTLRFLHEDGTVTVKRSYRTTIKTLLNGLRQLVTVQDMDFGTLIMTLSCNTSLVQNLTDIAPSIDKTTRFKIISNITQLHWGIGQLVQSVKSIDTVASFISEQTLTKMQLMTLDMKNQLNP